MKEKKKSQEELEEEKKKKDIKLERKTARECETVNVKVKITNFTISFSFSIERHVALDVINTKTWVTLYKCPILRYFEPIQMKESKYFLTFDKFDEEKAKQVNLVLLAF